MTRAVARRGRDAHSWSRAGAAMTLVVLFLPCLLVASALVLDAGALLLARACLAAAADMGALAGVQGLDYERLAEGDIVIKEAEAAADAEAWVRDNLAGRAFIEAGSVVVAVEVLNPDLGSGGGDAGAAPAGRDRVAACPVTGRILREPTVCVLVRARARLPFMVRLGTATVTVHADASVVGRPDD